MWAPLIYRVFSFVASRRRGIAVFLLWGSHAQEMFASSGARAAALSAGTWKRSADVACHFHPAAITAKGAVFFSPPNPFVVANRLLDRMGGSPIPW
jgi:uracil DNA glycosylase